MTTVVDRGVQHAARDRVMISKTKVAAETDRQTIAAGGVLGFWGAQGRRTETETHAELAANGTVPML